MKKFISILSVLVLCFSVASYSQLSPDDIGLPDDIYQSLKNVVFTQEYIPGRLELTKYETKRTVNGVTTTTKEVVLREARTPSASTTQAGVYGLNLVSYYVNDYGYDQIIATDSGYHIVRSTDGMSLNIWSRSGKWYSRNERPDKSIMLTDPYTKVTRFYSQTELLLMKYFPRGVTKPQVMTVAILDKFSNRYRIGQEYNPQTHVTNLFATITKPTSNTYRGNIYINGNLVTSGATLPLITSYGTTGIRVGAVRWRFLNECTPGDGGQMSSTNVMGSLYYEYGNFGTCDGQSSGTINDASLTTSVEAGLAFDYNNTEPDLVTYNSSKKFWIWFQYETQGANGKNEGSDAYYNVSENRPLTSLSGN